MQILYSPRTSDYHHLDLNDLKERRRRNSPVLHLEAFGQIQNSLERKSGAMNMNK